MSKNKNDKCHGEHLGMVTLSYDDLEMIVNILSKVSKEVKFRHKDKEFSNLEEVTLLENKRIKSFLEIKTFDPFISVYLGKNDIWLYIADKTPEQVSIFNEIRRFLKSRPAKRGFPPQRFTFMILGIIAWGILFNASDSLEWLKEVLPVSMFFNILAINLILALLGGWIVFSGGAREISLIYTLRKNELPNPKKVFAVAVFFSILIGVLTTIIVKHFGLIDEWIWKVRW